MEQQRDVSNASMGRALGRHSSQTRRRLLQADPAPSQIVFTILCTSMVMTRRRDFKILGSDRGYERMPLDEPDSDSTRSSDDLDFYDVANDDDEQDPISALKHLPKTRWA